MEGMIEITGVDLRKFVKETYALSRPQGLGFIHAQPGDLPEEDTDFILRDRADGARIAASMDYVKGRACKMTVFREGEKLFIRPSWFDHSASALRTLLERCGLPERAELVREFE